VPQRCVFLYSKPPTRYGIIDVKSPGELLFCDRLGNAWLASPVHVYLDLLKGEGRAKEMAEHLRRERIRC
jgi:hypothetical protein